MTTPSTTVGPTLATDWTPAEPGCRRTDEYWIWSYNGPARDARTVMGGPSQTTMCFESAWLPTVTYAASGCPSRYTPACGGSSSSAVTCCPAAHTFSCQTDTVKTEIHADWFRCVSAYATQDTATVTLTDFISQTIGVGIRTRHKNEHLFALALMYTMPPSTTPQTSLPTSSTSQGAPTTDTPTPTPTPTPEPNPSSGLSAGAAAGIGIGATAAVILLLVLAWFLYRRRRAARISMEGGGGGGGGAAGIPQYQQHSSLTSPAMTHIPTSPSPMTTNTPPMAPSPFSHHTRESHGSVGPLTTAKANAAPSELPGHTDRLFELEASNTNNHMY